MDATDARDDAGVKDEVAARFRATATLARSHGIWERSGRAGPDRAVAMALNAGGLYAVAVKQDSLTCSGIALALPWHCPGITPAHGPH